MKMTVMIAAMAFALAIPAAAKDQRNYSDDELIDGFNDANERCRGGAGDDPETLEWCEMRNTIDRMLKIRGWCFGPDNVPAYEAKWYVCH